MLMHMCVRASRVVPHGRRGGCACLHRAALPALPALAPLPCPACLQLYIGGLISGAVTDVALRQLFDAALMTMSPVPPTLPPVVNVNMHSDGRYAFVEFRTPEDASVALALNGVRSRREGGRWWLA
jgi:hypothetical protein